MSVMLEGETGGGRQAYALPLETVRPNPRQPRREFDDYTLMELASSIRQHGLLQPITVRVAESGYEILMLPGAFSYMSYAELPYAKTSDLFLMAIMFFSTITPSAARSCGRSRAISATAATRWS